MSLRGAVGYGYGGKLETIVILLGASVTTMLLLSPPLNNNFLISRRQIYWIRGGWSRIAFTKYIHDESIADDSK